MDRSLITKKRFLLKMAITVLVLWTIVFVTLFSWSVSVTDAHVIKLAEMEAKANFNKDIALRNWNAKRGGVYVTVSPSTPPNPYLKHIPNRDIITSDGKLLTLMNPAYMLRQNMDEFSQLYGIKGRITSLKPLNPINTPDDWEKRVLLMFNDGVKDYSEFTTIENKPYLRYMQAFITTEDCLTCHEHQGYKVGDVRGGIGVSIPIEPYLKVKGDEIRTIMFSYGIIWSLGVIGIGLGYYYAKQFLDEQYKAALALRLAKDDAERLSQFDGLTGLKNRRYLDEYLIKEIKCAARGRYPLGLLMIDIDWFKHFNDYHGHLTGDAALRCVAQCLQELVQRPYDLVARYGGEEFCIVLPQTDYYGTKSIAEKFRQGVESIKIATKDDVSHTCLSISVGGISIVPNEDCTPEMFIETADTALYHAKRNGKNQVFIKKNADVEKVFAH